MDWNGNVLRILSWFRMIHLDTTLYQRCLEIQPGLYSPRVVSKRCGLLDTTGMWGLRLLTSRDGLDWDLHSQYSLRTDVSCPTVILEEGIYSMYYTSYGETCDLAVAFSWDGIRWEEDNGPIILPDENSSYDSLYCSNASVIIEPDGPDKLYYSSRIDMDHKYCAIALAVKELI